MTAADNLARWRETEQAATEGPWESSTANRRRSAWVRAAGGHMVDHYIRPEDAEFIAAARTAVPALLAFVDEVLALCDWADANPELTGRMVHPVTLRQVAEKHLGSDQ